MSLDKFSGNDNYQFYVFDSPKHFFGPQIVKYELRLSRAPGCGAAAGIFGLALIVTNKFLSLSIHGQKHFVLEKLQSNILFFFFQCSRSLSLVKLRYNFQVFV